MIALIKINAIVPNMIIPIMILPHKDSLGSLNAYVSFFSTLWVVFLDPEFFFAILSLQNKLSYAIILYNESERKN